MEIPDRPHRIPAAPDTQEFQDGYRLLAQELASGVAVVAARHRRRDVAATVTGWLDVSYDPPTLLVSLFEEGRICEAVEQAGSWTLSVLERGQQRHAAWLASPGNPVDGLLDTVPFRRAPGSGAPVVDGALAWFEVRTDQVVTAATHQLVIGTVTAMGRGAAQGGPGAEGAVGRPLVHWAREYRGLDVG